MNEITPRFLPLDFLRSERDTEASKFQLALNENNARGPNGQRQGPVLPRAPPDRWVKEDPEFWKPAPMTAPKKSEKPQ